ncbi:beta-glucuronosyltransferase GlcAT14A-like isoform X2 [Carya illinoinensis]|uniref:beta-glucuronosyltransferase GlcAT14A-like isoform X2 n=1 Tax=Carya illinoinensis TaxID=32201 RepID=UPI001C721029|nr:beta-glucuronosyltransferase GlcAT14A-like isoform X2 [Carya illinoinensis]
MQNPSFLPPQLRFLNATITATSSPKDPKTTLYIIIAASLFSIVFFISISSSSFSSTTTSQSGLDPFLFPNRQTHRVLFPDTDPSSDPTPPSIAYLISGSAGDCGRIIRLLLAAYHPRNHYLLHLDLSAPQSERDALALIVRSLPIFKAAQNVNVIGKADFAYPKGSSTIPFTLHGASILLRLSADWDWFVSLNAADYPLVTQDDLLHILSFLPKDLNFLNHSSYIGWRESRKLRPIIVYPGLYLSKKTGMFYATQKRELPNAFQLFTGSSFSILNRYFIEFCILGTDNLPRTLLMYFANTPSSLSNYFATVLCNSLQFKRAVINHNLLYVTFDKHSNSEPHLLSSSDYEAMIKSGAAFARRFQVDDPVLNRIDQEILGRSAGKVVPSGWCLGESGNHKCSVWGDANVLRPGPGARRLEKRIVELLSNGTFQSHQCIVE